jgi:hypothetical protein
MYYVFSEVLQDFVAIGLVYNFLGTLLAPMAWLEIIMLESGHVHDHQHYINEYLAAKRIDRA